MVTASSWICGRLMIQSQMRTYFDSPIRFENSLGSTPIQTLPRMGQRWCEQALRTLIGPTIISSFRRGVWELGHRGGGVAADEHLVDEHLGDALGGLLRVVVAVGVDDQRAQHLLHLGLDLGLELLELAGGCSAMLSLAWKRHSAPTSR